MSAPIIETVSLIGFGSRSPASCKSSNASSMPRTSSAVENGTSCLDATMLMSNFVGIIS